MKALLVFCFVFASSNALDGVKIQTTFLPEECEVKAEDGNLVVFSYTAYLSDGKVFSSSKEQLGGPVSHSIGSGQASPHFDQGIIGMCNKEKRRITLPATEEFTYKGFGGHATTGEMVSFDIEMIEIVKMDKVFVAVDTNKDQKIDRDEMRAYMQRMLEARQKVNPDLEHADMIGDQETVINNIFMEEDTDKDGFISQIEFGHAPRHAEL